MPRQQPRVAVIVARSCSTLVAAMWGVFVWRVVRQAPPDWFTTGAQLWLDLGSVKNLAELTVNGKPLGILWKPPFRANVTGALKAGANTVEISVTNLWVNRLIGDQQPGATQYTYTAMKFYRADSPLLPSGLIGPVTVLRRTVPKP